MTGEAPPGRVGPGGATPAGASTTSSRPQIRPIRVRTRPRSHHGAAFVYSPAFKATLAAPPLALLPGPDLRGRMRAHLGGENEAKPPAPAARDTPAAGCGPPRRTARRDAIGDAYVEIDRVLREALAERLRGRSAGLRLDELGELLGARGLPAEDGTRRASPRSRRATRRGSRRAASRPAGRAGRMLERAATLIDASRRRRSRRGDGMRSLRAMRRRRAGWRRGACWWSGWAGARQSPRRGLAARQRRLPARRLRRRRRRLRGARSPGGSCRATSPSTWATPTSARGRWAPRSGRSSAR